MRVLALAVATAATALPTHHAEKHRRHTWQHTTASWFNDAQLAWGSREREHPHLGVAHRTLPHHAKVRICHDVGSRRHHVYRCVTGEVVDRGPGVPGRDLDLLPETKAALDCSDLCRVGWHPGRR